MDLIKDIRFYPQEPYPLLDKYDVHGMKDILQRLLFLLRHEGFTFGSFDHLYMNYTPSLPHGQVQRSQRPVSREFSWLQYADAGCDPEVFQAMPREKQRQFLAETVRKAAHLYADEANCAILDRCYEKVMTQGAALEIPYKAKDGEHLRIAVCTTISDDVQFLPIIRIYDKAGSLLREERLKPCSRDAFLAQFGTISLGKKTVRIDPRKSWYLERQSMQQLKFTL